MRKSFLVAFFVMLVSGIQCVYAQSVANKVLSSLQFEAPKNLYHAKGDKANMRTQPSTKAKLAVANGYFSFIGRGLLVEDLGNNPNWVTTKVGGKTVYISKSVMVKENAAPNINYKPNLPYCWQESDGDMDPDILTWRVGKIPGNSGLLLCEAQMKGENYYLLGKQVDNVLVFKYRIKIETNYSIPDEMMPIGKYFLESDVEEGVKTYYFKPSKDKVVSFSAKQMGFDPQNGPYYCYDLTKVSENIVYSMFKEVIEKNQTFNYYLTSFNFTNEWYRLPG